jgi:hypothetical protein
MVLAGRLLTDGITSPLLYGTPERTVDQAIWEISDALGPEQPEYELDPVAW